MVDRNRLNRACSRCESERGESPCPGEGSLWMEVPRGDRYDRRQLTYQPTDRHCRSAAQAGGPNVACNAEAYHPFDASQRLDPAHGALIQVSAPFSVLNYDRAGSGVVYSAEDIALDRNGLAGGRNDHAAGRGHDDGGHRGGDRLGKGHSKGLGHQTGKAPHSSRTVSQAATTRASCDAMITVAPSACAAAARASMTM